MSRSSQVWQASHSGCNRDTGGAAPRSVSGRGCRGCGASTREDQPRRAAPRATSSAVSLRLALCKVVPSLVNRHMNPHHHLSANQDPSGYLIARPFPLVSNDVSLVSAKLEDCGFKRVSGRIRCGRQLGTSCKYESDETVLADEWSTSNQSERDKDFGRAQKEYQNSINHSGRGPIANRGIIQSSRITITTPIRSS